MDTYNLLKNAVLTKQQVIASYNGYRREMCPHALGLKNGKEHCLFYQFAGQSSSGPIIPGSEKNWRCIPVSGLMDVSAREGQWHTSLNHSKKQTCIDNVDVEVSI